MVPCVGDVLGDLLQAQGEVDDPGDHREVQVGVRVAAQPDAVDAAARGQHPLGHWGHDVEVGPPQRDTDRQPQQRSDRDRRGERELRRPHAHGDQRFAESDDHDEPVPLGEVPGCGQPPVGARRVDTAVVDQQRQCPQRGLRGTAKDGTQDEQDGGHPDGQRGPQELAAQAGVARGGHGVDGQMAEANHGEGAREQHRSAEAAVLVIPRLRDRERDEEQGRHRDDDRRPDHAHVGVRLVAQPGVAAPGEPEQSQQHQTAEHAARTDVVGHEGGDLRDREDEHQVEEQLEGGDGVPLVGGQDVGPQAQPPARRRGGRAVRRMAHPVSSPRRGGPIMTAQARQVPGRGWHSGPQA
jgi:hypothetical protein